MKMEEVKKKLMKLAPAFAKKIAPLYVQLNWKWNGEGVPREEQILSIINHLINDLSEETTQIATGGIIVFHDKEEREYGIRFDVSETIFY